MQLLQLDWSPILEPAARARASEVITTIAEALRTPPLPYAGRLEDDGLGVSLFGRQPGFALFYAYLSRARDAAWEELVHEHIEAAIHALPAAMSYKRPYFAYGIAGLGWALQHLDDWILEVDDDALVEIDDLIGSLVSSAIVDQVGVRVGLSGYAIYALERLPHPASRASLDRIVASVLERAEPIGDGITWRLPVRHLADRLKQRWPDGAGILGVLDGAGGVVGALGACAREGVAGATNGFAAGCRGLWTQIRDGRMPEVAGGATTGPSCWARGDIGIAGVVAAASTDDEIGCVLALARHLATSVDVSTNADASLETGAAGIAHVMNRLYHRTGDPVFRDAARRWFDRTLALFGPDTGFGGFRFWQAPIQNEIVAEVPTGWVDMPGLVNGVAGIGLALIAATSACEPAWDRMMLLSSRRPSAIQ